jgi:hypothetical protein
VRVRVEYHAIFASGLAVAHAWARIGRGYADLRENLFYELR